MADAASLPALSKHERSLEAAITEKPNLRRAALRTAVPPAGRHRATNIRLEGGAALGEGKIYELSSRFPSRIR